MATSQEYSTDPVGMGATLLRLSTSVFTPVQSTPAVQPKGRKECGRLLLIAGLTVQLVKTSGAAPSSTISFSVPAMASSGCSMVTR